MEYGSNTRASGLSDQSYDIEQYYRTNGGGNDGTEQSACLYSQQAKQESAYQGAYDSHNDITKKPKAATCHAVAGKPARYCSDAQKNE